MSKEQPGQVATARQPHSNKALKLDKSMQAVLHRVQDQPKIGSMTTKVRNYDGFNQPKGGL